MKITGIIAEYNPFHNGHKYHMEEARRLTDADAVIVIMSGDYVQRGAPAVMPKSLRTRCALDSGADLVIELPVPYATGSAEFFALGAVSILERLGCVDALCFGAETPDIRLLEMIAQILIDEPDAYKNRLKEHLKQGEPFPAARLSALTGYFSGDSSDVSYSISEISKCLGNPNNILGIEYIKALKKLQSKIRPYAILRRDEGYHSRLLPADSCFTSASAIRKALKQDPDFITDAAVNETYGPYIPEECKKVLQKHFQKRYPVWSQDFSLLLKYRLLLETRESLCRYQDVSEELAARIMKLQNQFESFDQFCLLLKTKELTYTRISRALLHIILGDTKEDLQNCLQNGISYYARVLGFRKGKNNLLAEIKNASSIPLLTKLTHTNDVDPVGKVLLTRDVFASNLYESVITEKYKEPFQHEYTKEIVILSESSF